MFQPVCIAAWVNAEIFWRSNTGRMDRTRQQQLERPSPPSYTYKWISKQLETKEDFLSSDIFFFFVRKKVFIENNVFLS